MIRWRSPLAAYTRSLTTSTHEYTPPAASLAFRAQIASTLSERHRYKRPTVPFYQLRAHRVPTLWTLYRGLLSLAPNELVRWRIRKLFERQRHLTSPQLARTQLQKAQRWLDTFKLASAGSAHHVALVDRYARLLSIRTSKWRTERLFRDEQHWRAHLANRPILTGAFMRPSFHNPVLPRLKPQPIHITGLIVSRLRARVKRLDQQTLLGAWKQDIQAEAFLEDRLLGKEGAEGKEFGGGKSKEWFSPINDKLRLISKSFELDAQRRSAPVTPAMLAQVRAARSEKVRNKRSERERELRGEVTNRTVKQRRKGYPVGAMIGWSDEKKAEMLAVRRSVGVVGWHGALKRRLGWKLKGAPEEEMLEGEKKERVERLEKEFQAVSERQLGSASER
ncbi:hypothetical protein PENSPDRAFT_654551 [Peniophora sp. CONT]|nr:hypothetical protein PENSPDRAFT_654551 [Peniophora sp. CONT]